jgi:hypothetical protein
VAGVIAPRREELLHVLWVDRECIDENDRVPCVRELLCQRDGPIHLNDLHDGALLCPHRLHGASALRPAAVYGSTSGAGLSTGVQRLLSSSGRSSTVSVTW